MRKWMFVIFPSALLGLFLIFYFAENKRVAARDAQRAIDTAKKIEDDAAKEKVLKAEADAKARAEKRAADEAAKDAAKIARWNADSLKIQEATDKARAASNESAAKIAALETEL